MADLLATLRKAGFAGDALRTAYGIAMAESGGNPRALNQRAPDDSRGIFQINLYGPLRSRVQQYGLKSAEDLYDPLTNARVAYRLSGGGKNFKPWTTFTSGAYKKYLSGAPAAQQAAAAAQGTPSSPVAQPRINTEIAAYVQRALGNKAPRQLAARAQPQPPAEIAAYVQRAVGRKATAKANPADISAYVQRATGNRAPTDANERTDAGSLIDTSIPRKGTHITDGLDWNQGRKTAVDIMASPGTPVGAPEDGQVVRWGSAQGGEALYFQGASGRMYWLGHIDDRAPVGSRVSQGAVLARVSADHPAPHVHFDYKL